MEKELQTGFSLVERMWARREIENYLVTPASLKEFVQQGLRSDDLIEAAERKTRLEILEACLDEIIKALKLTNRLDPWGPDIKITDEFLDPLFRLFYERLGIPQQIFKRDYHGLADAIPLTEISPEISQILDSLLDVTKKARPELGSPIGY